MQNKYTLFLVVSLFVVMGIFMIFKLKTKNTVKLPYATLKSNVSLEKAIQSRRSVRAYKDTPLTLQEIAKLLFAAQGITNKQNSLRAVPSAGALYPIEIYLVAGKIKDLPAGLYKYNHKQNELETIKTGDLRNTLYNATLSQEAIKDCAANIVICGIYQKTTGKYGDRGKAYVHMEVGAAAQNIYLQAEPLEIGTVFIGAFDDKKVQQVLGLDNEQTPFCIMPLGKKERITKQTEGNNMGKMGTEILEIDVQKVIDELRKAYAEEWLAYYQYWLGAKLAKGPMKESVIAELEEHANDELRHAQMLTERIISLGGTPPLSPDDWPKVAECQYLSPEDPHVKKLLEQNIEGERCAIKSYNKLIKMVKDKDVVTYNMALEILADEVEHEEDLENLLEDLKIGKH